MDGARSADTVAVMAPISHTWSLMPIQLQWLQECTPKYGFDNVDETLRHLIYLANSEPAANKRLIFRIKRCLHCHVGARADQHTKVELRAQVHMFQMQWLINVTDKCDIKSLEKCVRIICDYYQSRAKRAALEEDKRDGSAVATTETDECKGDGKGKGLMSERDLFSIRREEDARLIEALRIRLGKADSDCAGEDESESKMGCALNDLANDTAACSEEETLEAIRRCQVGRGSESYAEARGESREETEKRREKELKVEQSEEAKKTRERVARALGSVMG